MKIFRKELTNLQLFTRFRSLTSSWWGIELLLIDKNQEDLLPEQKARIQNESLKSLFDTNLFKQNFFQSVKEAFTNNKDQQFLSVPWKQAGFDLWLVPWLLSDQSESYVVATGFLSSKNNEKKIMQSLSYAKLPEDKIKKCISQLKILEKSEQDRAKDFLSTLAKESFNLIQEKQEQSHIIEKIKQESHYENMIGKSGAVQILCSVLDKIKDYDAPILIQGEPGTGKKLLANLIHNQSEKANKEFFIQDCVSLNKSFFKRNFLSDGKKPSLKQKKLFKQGEKGTLVFNEIANLSTEMQTCLLQALNKPSNNQEEIRIIATTSQNIEDMMEAGAFSKDLYYQLNIINIKTPSLQNRKEDIPLLVNYFLKQKEPFCNKKMAPEVLEIFSKYSWPKNIKQLKEEVETMLSLSNSNTDILTENLISPKVRENDESYFHSSAFKLGDQSLKSFLRDIEKQVIINALKRENGNKTRAAKLLGFSRTSIVLKTKEYGLADYNNAENF